MKTSTRTTGLVFLLALTAWTAKSVDWTDYRGPNRDGHSPEKNLPVAWKRGGDGQLWRTPIGGRSAPVVFRNRVYLMTTVGKADTLQERVVCLDGDTGKQLWEHRSNVYLSDVPPHRAAWSSPTVDPETGNVYFFGVGGVLGALSPAGKIIWEHSLAEEIGLVTTHGGRTVSPVVEENLVVISGVTTGWGDQARAAHRFFAFDKKTGDIVWMSSPGGRPYDTTYSPPVIATVDGVKMFIAGASDGAAHALKFRTGEPLWNYTVSKRGLNTGVVMNGSYAIVTHSEENIESNEMGLVASVDARHRGPIGPGQVRWSIKGFQGGFSTPIVDGDRVYQVDNGANLFAFDVNTGRNLWQLNLGTIQKASPVLAEGKLYVGTENGKFFIIQPGQEKATVLSEVEMGTAGAPEMVIASPAVSDGRVFIVTTEATYAIGRKSAVPAAKPASPPAPSTGKVAHVQVFPAEVLLKPGQAASFKLRLFDDKGVFIREGTGSWTLDRLKGSIDNGKFQAAPDNAAQAGLIKATVEGVTGVARARVVPPLPWTENFDTVPLKSVPPQWVNATGKNEVREVEGNKVMVKLADNPFTKRARLFMGPVDLSNYTIEADTKAVEKRRQMGDAGVVAQRYQLTLFGNSQKIELQSWQPETARTASKPFAWKADTWYRMKLRVESAAGGKVIARGKAWPAADPEPAEWTIERTDSIPNLKGSPGIYADAPFEISFDNIKVTPNN